MADAKPEIRSFCAGEIRAIRAEGGKNMLAGYAAVYDTRTSEKIWGEFWEVIRRGAFAAALGGREDVRMLVDHNSGLVLARTKAGTLRLSDDNRGLKFEADIPDTTAGRDLMISVERGDISQMSFGFRMLKQRWTEEASADGSKVEAVRELLEVKLHEISAVAFPAYEPTEIGVREEQLAELRSWRSSQPAKKHNVNAKARLRLGQLI